MNKRILVTSGGTSERIDDVRKITNHSTGHLGSLIADAFADAGYCVDCITTATAVYRPQNPHAQLFFIESVEDLNRELRALLEQNRYDCVIHAMAVSDYTVDTVTSLPALARTIQNGETAPSGMKVAGKLPSDLDSIVLVLRPAPKVIGCIKELQPDTLLFGFKLLSGASPEDLKAAAMKVLRKNGCDYVVANDMVDIIDDRHAAVLYSPSGIFGTYQNKNEIARGILACAQSHWRNTT